MITDIRGQQIPWGEWCQEERYRSTGGRSHPETVPEKTGLRSPDRPAHGVFRRSLPIMTLKRNSGTGYAYPIFHCFRRSSDSYPRGHFARIFPCPPGGRNVGWTGFFDGEFGKGVDLKVRRPGFIPDTHGQRTPLLGGERGGLGRGGGDCLTRDPLEGLYLKKAGLLSHPVLPVAFPGVHLPMES